MLIQSHTVEQEMTRQQILRIQGKISSHLNQNYIKVKTYTHKHTHKSCSSKSTNQTQIMEL